MDLLIGAVLTLKKPSDAGIRDFLTRQRESPFSYQEVGATRHAPPQGYVTDHHRIRLGEGEEIFSKAKLALDRWAMFQIPWLTLCWPDTPAREGSHVAVLVQCFGLWILSACRVVYQVEEKGALERSGFAYGTLPAHMEMGEERFTVEWNRSDNSVWYDILAFSRPNHLLSWLGYLYARRLQRQFAQDSLNAMALAAGSLPDL